MEKAAAINRRKTVYCCHPGQLQHPVYALCELFPGHALQNTDIAKIFLWRIVSIIAQVLGKIPYFLPVRTVQPADVLPIVLDLSLCGEEQRGDHFHQRGLPGPVGRQQPVDAVIQLQLHIRQYHSLHLSDTFRSYGWFPVS